MEKLRPTEGDDGCVRRVSQIMETTKCNARYTAKVPAHFYTHVVCYDCSRGRGAENATSEYTAA